MSSSICKPASPLWERKKKNLSCWSFIPSKSRETLCASFAWTKAVQLSFVSCADVARVSDELQWQKLQSNKAKQVLGDLQSAFRKAEPSYSSVRKKFRSSDYSTCTTGSGGRKLNTHWKFLLIFIFPFMIGPVLKPMMMQLGSAGAGLGCAVPAVKLLPGTDFMGSPELFPTPHSGLPLPHSLSQVPPAGCSSQSHLLGPLNREKATKLF